jgi:hypothetical protein
MEMPLRSGRALTVRDDGAAPRVAVVNEAFARSYYAGENPLGGRFSFGSPAEPTIEIVGVVADAKYTGQRDAAPPTVYVPYPQAGVTQVNFALRTDGDPALLVADVRSAVHDENPRLPIFEVRTQEALALERVSTERRLAWASTLGGAIALLLTCVALYGTVSWQVARRTREIGIRVALGAERPDVLASVVVETVSLVAVGLIGGALLTRATAPLLMTQLFEVDPGAPGVQLTAALVLLIVALAAASVPARRAARVDPLVALRAEG